MMVSTVTSKGQMTIPKEVRDKLKMKPGDKVIFSVTPDGRAYFIVKNKTVADIAGMLHRPGAPSYTIEEINEGIGQAIAEENDPKRWSKP